MRYLIIALIMFSSNSFSASYSICSEKDSRVQLPVSPIARISKEKNNSGCTATLIGKNCAITAGHCVSNLHKGEFNVPNSIEGEPVQSTQEDTFFIDPNSIKFQDEGRGNDWAVFKFKKNKKTGLYPGDLFGHFEVENYEPKNSDLLKISGYGIHYNDKQISYTLLSAQGLSLIHI